MGPVLDSGVRLANEPHAAPAFLQGHRKGRGLPCQIAQLPQLETCRCCRRWIGAWGCSRLTGLTQPRPFADGSREVRGVSRFGPVPQDQAAQQHARQEARSAERRSWRLLGEAVVRTGTPAQGGDHRQRPGPRSAGMR